ncbi:MAG: hypothetical protein WKF45_05740 [Ilumatobacteraceae bacterium]
MTPERFAPVLAELAPLVERCGAAGERLLLVGGTVRDLLLSSTSDGDFDLDLTTSARPPVVKRLVDGWAHAVWTQGERFGTIGAKRAAGSTRSPRSAPRSTPTSPASRPSPSPTTSRSISAP